MSLLEQAIIDAQELKEAALKSAESAILEKYSADIREAVDTMLGAEEDEEDPMAPMMGGMPEGDPMMGGMPEEEKTLPEEGIPFAADAEVKLCPCPDDDEEISISFDQLQTMAGEMGEEGGQAPEEALAMAMGAEEEEEKIPMLESIDLDELLGECGEMMPSEPMAMGHSMEQEEDGNTIVINLEEQEEYSDDLPPDADQNDDSLMYELEKMVREAVKVDLIDSLSSQDNAATPVPERKKDADDHVAEIAQNPSREDMTPAEEAFALRTGLQLAEAKKAIGARDAQIKDLKENLQTLAESSEKLKQTFMLMREQFEETNLSNAKLLYTNRTLKSTSLNERQKNRIVESIQSADTIEEAKVIYETLQSTVGGSSKSTPKSLNEAIKRPSMNMPRRRRENSQRESLVKDRFQALAGIKK
jgi:hypothetical protein